MRHVLHISWNSGTQVLAIFSLGIAVLLAGCASTVEIDASDPESVAQAHYWAFLNHDPPIELSEPEPPPEFTYRVTSPLRDARALDAHIADCIEAELAARGYERVEGVNHGVNNGVKGDADFYVDFQLTLQPRAETVEVPLGQQFVPSFSYSQSYIVEGLEISERTFEAFRLEIDLRERRGRILWRGELLRELRARDKLVLGSDVGELIDYLPRATVIPGRDTVRSTVAVP
jgi:hypothetical protein